MCGNRLAHHRLARPLLWLDPQHNLVEFEGDFKFEPLGNIDMEIINNLGLSNLGSMGCSNVMLSCHGSQKARKFPLQVPDLFNLKNEGYSISFTVPSHLNFRIRCLSVCSIYALSDNQKGHEYNWDAHTIISNTTKSLIWSHSPHVFGIPEADEDMMMLSYWKFENQLESGDELNISVVGDVDFQVKEVGVHLVYKEQEEKSSQSTSEEASQQFSLYGNVVPGNASVEEVISVRENMLLLFFDFDDAVYYCLGEATATGIIFYFGIAQSYF
ncbi:hypothetical protein TEA_009217 [Camellia sinensis var. sinensis]|uniref:Uncharacterized protein n=1 Tax=Camellia sinensis var. sinensis TaxID=542762 RepID=A0A4S4EEC3_CAMSN|nr:hypothetical protein TEA_009217 [Camellia sinensis var. sinensis]